MLTMRFASAFLVAAPRQEPARLWAGAGGTGGCAGRAVWGVIWETVTRGGFWRALLCFPEAGGILLCRKPAGSAAALRSNIKILEKMARIRIQGTPNLKKQIKLGLILVERMPQRTRALSEVMNAWMKIPSWTYYGLRAAGYGFAWLAETPGW